MEPDGNLWVYILLLFALILTNAFFAMSEIAIISLNDQKVRRMAADGDKTAAILAKLVSEPSKFLATIQVGVTLSGLLASAVAADTFAEYIVYALRAAPVNPAVVRVVSLAVITMVLSFFTLVFGELVPKRLAMTSYEKISFAIARPLLFIYKVERPFVALLSYSTNAVLRLLGVDPHQKPEEVTEEEIRMMVDAGNESGTIEKREREMINNIFEFDDRTVGEIMTHRTEMVALELHTPLTEVIRAATVEGFSRIPVYAGKLDDVVGVLYVKDLLGLVMENPDVPFSLENHMRKPIFVPEGSRCTALFSRFNEEKVQIAIVVDEYGGTAGMVTMEDLIESIVGNIQDEYDDEEEEISALSDGSWSIDGTVPLEEVEELFQIHFPADGDYDTLGGYIIDTLGHIPAADEHPSVTVGLVEFTVAAMDDRRIERVLARPLA
ncbi:hemolysin family protein [Anaerotruncus rubiinfantis]|uniref:hemolysin family protein n=1 Tax=Anaerotruncus rubiinfantis TaxID=1720200 RepID=UPI001899AB79|nr:hemolysin family protein [Anaerotruncus rubiinfantis]